MIPTVKGLRSADELGFTLMHEHVSVLSPDAQSAFPFLYDRDEIVREIIPWVDRAEEQGVRTLVDVTAAGVGHGRDIDLMCAVAERTDVNLVASTGVYLQVPLALARRDPDQLAEIFVRELCDGIGATRVRAGMLKVASDETITAPQEVVLRAAARASVATGAPITAHTHAEFHTGLRQLDILEEEGVDLRRVVIGHSITFDRAYLERLIERGCCIGWDHYSWSERLPVAQRDRATDLLHELLANGYSSQVVISQDGVGFCDFEPEYPRGFTYVSEVVLPRLRARGTTEESIHDMTVGTPARLLDWA